MFFILRDLIAWAVWLLLADKKRLREILPVCFFAGLLGATSDNIIHHCTLWTFPSKYPLIPLISDDWGIYIVVTYFFIQWLPKQQTFWPIFLHLFLFTGIGITIKWIHVATHHMTHEKWWNYGCSYLANWFLYFTFYQVHKIFQCNNVPN